MSHFWFFMVFKECSSGAGTPTYGEMKQSYLTLAMIRLYKTCVKLNPLSNVLRASFKVPSKNYEQMSFSIEGNHQLNCTKCWECMSGVPPHLGRNPIVDGLLLFAIRPTTPPVPTFSTMLFHIFTTVLFHSLYVFWKHNN